MATCHFQSLEALATTTLTTNTSKVTTTMGSPHHRLQGSRDCSTGIGGDVSVLVGVLDAIDCAPVHGISPWLNPGSG